MNTAKSQTTLMVPKTHWRKLNRNIAGEPPKPASWYRSRVSQPGLRLSQD